MLRRGSRFGRRRTSAAHKGLLALLLALAGCSTSADWKSLQVAPRYQPPRAVTFKVTSSAAGADMAELDMAIVSAFAKWNVLATPLDEENARPSLRIDIGKWAPGSNNARGALGAAAYLAVGQSFAGSVLAEGELLVDVKLAGETGDVLIQGQVRGLVDRHADDTVQDIAELIAFTVVRGEAGQQAPESKPHTTYP